MPTSLEQVNVYHGRHGNNANLTGRDQTCDCQYQDGHGHQIHQDNPS